MNHEDVAMFHLGTLSAIGAFKPALFFNWQGQQIESLFDAISHGDEEHRKWLKKKIREHFKVPPEHYAPILDPR